MDPQQQSDVKSVIDAVERLTKPTVHAVDRIAPESGRVAFIPDGIKPVDLASFIRPALERPERRTGTAVVTTLASFIEHTNRFKDQHSAVFASDDKKEPSLTSVLDYHELTATGLPRFGTHRTLYRFPLSDEWRFWTQSSLEGIAQGAFAELIEDHLLDVLDPAGAGELMRDTLDQLDMRAAGRTRLRELARGLTVHVESKIATHKNLDNGEGVLVYEESHSDGQGMPVKVPNGFVVAIPVFRGGPLYQLAVRLRYRPRQGGVTWTVQAYGVDEVFRHAFEEACDRARTETELPLFFGKPEA